jgi:hypothetical protein
MATMLVGGDNTPARSAPEASAGTISGTPRIWRIFTSLSALSPHFFSASLRAKSVAEPNVLMPTFLPRRSSGLSMPLVVIMKKKGESAQ